MNPLAIHKKFVLVLSFWEVQDSDKIVVAVQREQTCKSITPLMLWMLLSHEVQENSFFFIHCQAPLSQHLHAGLGSLILSDLRDRYNRRQQSVCKHGSDPWE